MIYNFAEQLKHLTVFCKKNIYCVYFLLFAAVVLIGGVDSLRHLHDNVVINEVCTSNIACCEDENGDYPDWVELYNPTSQDVDISGYVLNKSVKRNKEKYVFPEGFILNAGSCFLFDPKFDLPSEGCTLNLLDSKGHYVDRVTIPKLKYDTVYARINDGDSKWVIKSPTPGYENGDEDALNPVIDGSVYASVDSGFYDDEFDLELKSSDWWRTVYYTTDGSNPVENGIKYDSPIHIYDKSDDENMYSMIPNVSRHYMEGDSELPSYKLDKCTVVKAVARDALGRYTDVFTYTYFIGYQNKSAFDNMTVVSVSADPDDLFSPDRGIMVLGDKYDRYVADGRPEEYEDSKANFAQRGRSAEREVSIEVFNENHESVLDAHAGLRIKGLSSRWDVQKSFYVFFRKAYGGSYKENFTVDGCNFNYHAIAIDKGGQEVYSKMKDTIMEVCMRESGCATTDRIPCCMFLNGEYNGFYWLTERYDRSYIADRYDVTKENVEFKDRDDIESYDDWKDSDFGLNSLIDYYASNIIVAHEQDWPDYNFEIWRTIVDEGTEYGDGKWHPVIYDMNSTSMETPEFDSFEHLKGFYPFMDSSWGHEDESREFRKNIVARIEEMRADEFEQQKILELIDELYDRINAQMILDIRRYNNCSASEAQNLFDANVDIIRNFYENRWKYLDEYKEKYLYGE